MAQAWETIIGQAIIDLVGSGNCAGTNPLALAFFNGPCGLYVLGILVFLAFSAYVLLMNIGIDATVLIFSLLFLLMASWGLIPQGIVFAAALVLVWLLYNFFKGFDFAK